MRTHGGERGLSDRRRPTATGLGKIGKIRIEV